jgi:hypothetical protein
MRPKPPQVAKKIRDELAEEKTVLIHVDRDWRKFVETGDDAYLKATAYDLHGFYGGLENEFRRFRHRIRNIYSFNLVPERIKALVEKLPPLSAEANTSLQDFAQFLDRVSKSGQ